MLPRPPRYCPVVDSGRLFIEATASLSQFAQQFPYVRVVQTCLCSSCFHAKLQCDPLVCAVKVTQALEWATTHGDQPLRAFGGACKRVAREYVIEERNRQEAVVPDYGKLGRALMRSLPAKDEDGD